MQRSKRAPPPAWEHHPAKRRQKDTEARWTVKHGENHYGYKNHVNVDKAHKLIRQYTITDAAVHGSQGLEKILLPAEAGKENAGWLARMSMRGIRPQLQIWDIASSRRIHGFIANSEHVAERIERLYGRPSTVVYPPVNWQSFQASVQYDGFYLMVTAFAPYKKVDMAIRAANELRVPLKIIGHGQNAKRLKQMAGPSVEFLGWQPDHRVREWYGRCEAVLFPGEEDFGIVPLEAMAAGKPVIAYGKGGVLETVIPVNPLHEHKHEFGNQHANQVHARTGQGTLSSQNEIQKDSASSGPTGVFYYDPSVAGLIGAIQLFEQHRKDFHPEKIRAHVEPFDRSHFKQRVYKNLMSSYEEFRQLHPC